jgi:hypothetical protein
MALILPGQQGGVKTPRKTSSTTLILPGKTSAEEAKSILERRAKIDTARSEASTASKEAGEAEKAAGFLRVAGGVAKEIAQSPFRSSVALSQAFKTGSLSKVLYYLHMFQSLS